MAKNFCVIGARVSQQWERTWMESETEAVEHATALARKSYAQHQKPITLYVVERKQVVELGMPEVVVRQPSDTDEAPATEGD